MPAPLGYLKSRLQQTEPGKKETASKRGGTWFSGEHLPSICEVLGLISRARAKQRKLDKSKTHSLIDLVLKVTQGPGR